MKLLNTKLKKVIFWPLTILAAFFILLFAFISPLTKWAIEKYDTKYTGREITLDQAYVNPFTGTVRLQNLKIHEAASDSVFISTGLSLNFEMLKLFQKTYEVSELVLSDPVIRVIQNKETFNFHDLVLKFSPKDSLSTSREPAHFNLLHAKIKNGTFYYIARSIPIYYFVKSVDIETNGKRWDADTMDFRFSFVSGLGTGGSMKGNFFINTSNLDYKLSVLANKYDLSILEQYVKDVANYGHVRGNLDARLEAEGNFKNARNLLARGPLAINDFHFGKKNEDYLSFKKLVVDIVQLSPDNKKYLFDSISLLNPYFKYKRYDTLDNLEDMFGKNGEKAQQSKAMPGKVNILFKIGTYIENLAKDFFKSEFNVRRLAVYNADLRYEDFSLNEKFSAAVFPLTIITDSVERSNKWVNLSLRSDIKPYGHLALDLSINPKDSSDFKVSYNLQKVSLAMLNPYFVTFTSFPMDRGIIEFRGQANVNNGIIRSTNHFVVIDPRVNNKQKRNGNNWLPMRVFMFLVRDRGNVIDYEIPVYGNLRDPRFKFGDAIMDMLTNIVVKPVTLPYRTEVKNTENEIEKSLTLKWVMRSSDLNAPQEKFIRNIGEFLKTHPGDYIRVVPELYTEREQEYQLFFEAKKNYYLGINKHKALVLRKKDSLAIEQLPIRDPGFIAYLNRRGAKADHTIQDKCRRVVKDISVFKNIEDLQRRRKAYFLSFFRAEGVEKQVYFGSKRDTVPFNGFSQFRIRFNSNYPDELLAAYQKMKELDDISPRNKFKAERRKDRALLDAK